MQKYRMNRSWHEYSAGTEVFIVDAGADTPHMVTVIPAWLMEDEYIEIPMEYLTKCRSMTDEIAVPTREDRRAKSRMDQARETA